MQALVKKTCGPAAVDLPASLLASPAASPIGRALAVTGGEAARRAALSLAVISRQYRALPRWSFSPLTGDGYPVEMAYSSLDSALRYTADPGSHLFRSAKAGIVPPLTATARILFSLGQEVLADSQHPLLPALQRMQADEELSYGCWISGRHGHRHEYKRYVEVPARAEQQTRQLLRSAGRPDPLSAQSGAGLRMLGLGQNPDCCEYY